MKTPKPNHGLLTVLLIITMLLPQSALATGVLNGIEIHGDKNEEQIVFTSNPGSEYSGSLTIRNSGRDSAQLKLYLHRADLEGQSFKLVDNKQEQSDFTDWISLDTKQITLESGATKTVHFTVKIPENAGIGKHVSAIMASQRIEDGQGGLINLDTGIRIHANIAGEKPQTAYKLVNSQQHEENGRLTYQTTVINKGNTDLRGIVSLGNLTHGPAQTDRREIRLQPGEEQKISLQTGRTPIGDEHIVAKFNFNGELQTFVLQKGLRLPIDELLGLLLFCSFIWLIRVMATNCKIGHNCPDCRKKNLAILLTVTLLMAGILDGLQTRGELLQANIFGLDEQTYLTTIKWGNFDNYGTQNQTVTAWQGQISTNNGRFDEIEKLHHESSDTIFINSSGNSILFKNFTGPDNDGIIVLVRAPSGKDIVLRMRNNLSGEEIQIPLDTTLKQARTINYKNSQIQIKSEIAPPELAEQIDQPELKTNTEISTEPAVKVNTDETEPLAPIFEFASTLDNTVLITDFESSRESEPVIETNLMTDLESTGDHDIMKSETTEEETEATKTETTGSDLQRLMEEIKLLTGLIRELPASPDVISEYILSSDFISSITSDGSSTTIIGSSRLIRTLVEMPLIIKEITATPDTNFLFFPNDRIKLASQNFSFSDRKTSSQEMNEIIFVQKRNTPWTVYFSISDLTALSGNSSIPASNITFTPGKINIVQTEMPAEIEAGPERKLTGRGDLVKVFTVTPMTTDENGNIEHDLTIFSIKPRLSIFIPPQTLPGLYRGEITFKAI